MGKASGNISPTRMALLQLKKKIRLATRGHSLLKEKRDAIIMQFFEKMDVTRDLQKEVNELLKGAYLDLTLAQASSGAAGVSSASLAVKGAAGLDIAHRNVMGVRIPSIEEVEFKRNVIERGYGLIGTDSRIDTAAADFEEVLTKLIRLAEFEHTLRLLGMEIRKTKRRVNALEYLTIPRMKKGAKQIQMRLDEMERENFFRLKVIKRRLQNATA